MSCKCLLILFNVVVAVFLVQLENADGASIKHVVSRSSSGGVSSADSSSSSSRVSGPDSDDMIMGAFFAQPANKLTLELQLLQIESQTKARGINIPVREEDTMDYSNRHLMHTLTPDMVTVNEQTDMPGVKWVGSTVNILTGATRFSIFEFCSRPSKEPLFRAKNRIEKKYRLADAVNLDASTRVSAEIKRDFFTSTRQYAEEDMANSLGIDSESMGAFVLDDSVQGECNTYTLSSSAHMEWNYVTRMLTTPHYLLLTATAAAFYRHSLARSISLNQHRYR